MKVIQIVTQMEAGDPQKVAHLLHEGLKARVRHPELWFLYTKRDVYQHRDGVHSLFDHPPKSFDYAVIAARLYRRLRETRPDVVITHTHYANVVGQAIAHAAGVPQRIAVHHNPLDAYPPAARILDRVLGSTGSYSGVVAVSEAVAATLQSYPRRYLRRLTTVRNGLAFPQREFGVDVRAQYEIPHSAPLLLNVGRLSPQKNHALLLHALRQVPEAHLAIVGAGELRESLAALARQLKISRRVHFTGEIPGHEVAAFFRSCDAFVFPSLWEGLPMAVIEALHAGAAIVASDIPAMREVLGDTALIVPANDAPALAGAIRRVLNDPELALTLRSSARRRAAGFNAGSMINGYYQLIHGGSTAAVGIDCFSSHSYGKQA